MRLYIVTENTYFFAGMKCIFRTSNIMEGANKFLI